MTDKVAFELVAPERLLASDEVDMVVVPGAEGDFGVLPLHAPFLSLLRPGVIDIFEGDKVSGRIFVAGGFAEANESGCIVLAEEAVPVEEIDLAAARERLSNAEDDLKVGADASEVERHRLEHAVAVAKAMIEAAGGAVAA